MNRGTPISRKPLPAKAEAAAQPGISAPTKRILNSREANAFLGRANGFLEKRRSSGINSPKFIQCCKGGRVTYRVEDLLSLEDAWTRTSSSETA